MLTASPVNWNNALLCMDDFNLTLNANITIHTLRKSHPDKDTWIQLPLPIPNLQRGCQLEVFIPK